MSVVEVFRLLCISDLVLSFSLNMLIIVLSVRLKSQHGDYNSILGLNAAVDLFISAITALSMASPVLSKDYYIVILNNPLCSALSESVINVLGASTLVCFLISPQCTVVHFWYRYSVLCKSRAWSFKRYAMGLSIPITYLLLDWVEIVNFEKADTPTIGRYLRTFPLLSNISMAYTAYPKDLTKFYVITFLHQCLVVLDYALISIYGYGIIKKLNEPSDVRDSTKKTLQKVVKVMILQPFTELSFPALYPLIFYFLPVAFLLATIWLDGSALTTGYICVSFIQLVPILNSLTVLTMVPQYRRAVFRHQISPSSDKLSGTRNLSQTRTTQANRAN